MRTTSFVIATILSAATAQQIGTFTSEYHAPMSLGVCTKAGGCQTQQKSVVMDANWRWTHKVNDYSNCYSGTSWDTSVCSDGLSCAQHCALDGVDQNSLKGTYGVEATGNDLKLGFVTYGSYNKNVGSRMYMMADSDNYEMFKLKNREFTVDVDVSTLPCGVNGALYFVEMSANGDKGKGANAAGARYGTGYCDAQCPHDVKFITGSANIESWNSQTATGKNGSCCAEMDIWEANSISTAYTLHPCNKQGQYTCSGVECGDADQRYQGVCDKDGCDLNAYRVGVHDFFGPGSNFKVNTTRPFSVVTQFITADGTDYSDIVEVKRGYVQDGHYIAHPMSNISGLSSQFDSITDNMCKAQKSVFQDQDDYTVKGSMKSMSDALGRGVVLVMSIWDDKISNMLWLDSTSPAGSTKPGASRGSCSTSSGKPDEVENSNPNAYVKYGNIKVGEIGSTYQAYLASEFLQ